MKLLTKFDFSGLTLPGQTLKGKGHGLRSRKNTLIYNESLTVLNIKALKRPACRELENS